MIDTHSRICEGRYPLASEQKVLTMAFSESVFSSVCITARKWSFPPPREPELSSNPRSTIIVRIPCSAAAMAAPQPAAPEPRMRTSVSCMISSCSKSSVMRNPSYDENVTTETCTCYCYSIKKCDFSIKRIFSKNTIEKTEPPKSREKFYMIINTVCYENTFPTRHRDASGRFPSSAKA